MNDPRAQYSIALPDMKQFRGLWGGCQLAKSPATRFPPCSSIHRDESEVSGRSDLRQF